MKKYIIIAISIAMGNAVYSISEKEIMRELEIQATKYEQNVLNTNAFDDWMRTFEKAQIFVTNKSKSFLGSQDQNIIDALAILSQANSAFNVLIKNTLPPLTTITDDVEIQKGLSAIQKHLNDIQKQISSAHTKALSSNKKEAKSVCLLICVCLTKFTQAAQNIHECSICTEIKQLVHYPCGNRHPADKMVCKSCLSGILAKSSPKCPICNAPLRK